MKILIAMNNEIYSEYLSFCLQGCHSLKVVHNGFDAITSLKEETWDKVIMGITLECYNGLEVIEQFREFQQTMSQDLSPSSNIYNPEIIIVTRIHNEKSKKSAASMGVRHYLNIPVDTSTLLELILTDELDYPETMSVLHMDNLQLITN